MIGSQMLARYIVAADALVELGAMSKEQRDDNIESARTLTDHQLTRRMDHMDECGVAGNCPCTCGLEDLRAALRGQ